jgi:flavin reductase (DIM6/NTAB) family NADH-FMN oxidoreductase RutF
MPIQALSRPAVSPDMFRDVMSAVCTPVIVVTTTTEEGEPYGTTVSAFAALSLSPPMVTAAIDNGSGLLVHARLSRLIGLNVLAHDQEQIASGFARKGTDRFAGIRWSWDDGLPRIEGAIGWLSADVDQFMPGGDHTLLLAAVRHTRTRPGPPLIYGRRQFGTHSELRSGRSSRS